MQGAGQLWAGLQGPSQGHTGGFVWTTATRGRLPAAQGASPQVHGPPQALPSLQRAREGEMGLQLLPLKARPRAPTAQLFLETLWTFVQQKPCRQPGGGIKVLPVLAEVGRGHHRRLLTCSGRPSVGSVAKLFTNPLVCTHPALVLGSVAQTRSKAQ